MAAAIGLSRSGTLIRMSVGVTDRLDVDGLPAEDGEEEEEEEEVGEVEEAEVEDGLERSETVL